MSLGIAPKQDHLYLSSRGFCEEQLGERSVYRLLAKQCHRLFGDEKFADLFLDVGRNSIPPRIVAVVMVLQRMEGLSDREAVERFLFDVRWKYAAGGLEFDHPGFVHTVLVDMRARLRVSAHPDRIFEAVLEVGREAGLVGRKRILDSTALYDAVATQDTVTLIRSAIRGVLRVASKGIGDELRAQLKRDDTYESAGKPSCDWDDAKAREELVDALAKDAHAILACLEGRTLEPELSQAAKLVATVVGQDLEQTEGGLFRIAQRVAKDRVISTVDPEARHGHKTAARGFDGYKGHISIDPDSELIVATEVTPGNAADGVVAEKLLNEAFAESKIPAVKIYGDSSYGTAELVEHIEGKGAEANVKVQAPPAREGFYSKDDFAIDLIAQTVTCPAGVLVQIRVGKDGGAFVAFRSSCATCPLRPRCTDAKAGRTIQIHPHEQTLQRSRTHQKSPAWKKDYRATRPKVERKFGRLMRHRHGGRRARVRGTLRVRHDFSLLGAAINLRRLAALGIHHDGSRWTR